jgi:hypothetical protein
MQQFRQVEDQLQADATSPDAVYAARYRAAIADNLAKEQWSDSFAWKAIGNDWQASERHGVLVRPANPGVSFTGAQNGGDQDRTELWRAFKNGLNLMLFEGDFVTGEKNGMIVGIAIVHEKVVAGNMSPYSEIALARDPTGQILYLVRESNRVVTQGQSPEGWAQLKENDVPVKVDPGEPVRLAIARVAGKKGQFDLLVNDQKRGVAEAAGLGSGSFDLKVALFGLAKQGSAADVTANHARMVRKKG